MKVLITDPIHDDGLKTLKKFAEVEVATNLTNEELLERVSEFDAMIVRSSTEVRKDVLDAAKNLKLIVRAGVGLDNIDLVHAGKLGIKVENTPEAPSNAVSELTIGLMIAWARNIPEADKSLKNGKWMKSQLIGTELRDKTFGLIGTGRIGCSVSEKAKAFGMNLLGFDPIKSDKFRDIGGEYSDLDTLLKKSDYVSLHVPLTPSTKHMIGEKEFEKMKNSAVLVNTARGAVVNEEALTEALKEGKIAGACLDVYEKDPAENKQLLNTPNVILTPHLGASSKEAQRAAGVSAAEKIKKLLNKTG